MQAKKNQTWQRQVGVDLVKRPFPMRATANFIYLVTCLLLTLLAKRMF